MKLTREKILKANKTGLENPDEFWSFYTPVLQVAFELGQRGIDLSDQPDVTGYRYGDIPANGLSYNYMDNRSERGLSLVALNGDKEVGSSIWFADRKKVKAEGILLSYKGSDGESLILTFDVEDLD